MTRIPSETPEKKKTACSPRGPDALTAREVAPVRGPGPGLLEVHADVVRLEDPAGLWKWISGRQRTAHHPDAG